MTVMEGPLSKWTNVMKGWQYRWFVLDDNAGLLSYYTSKEKMVRGARRGCVRLRGAVIGIDDEDDSTFTITVDGKMFHFQARDGDERERWLRALEDTILRHTHSNLLLHKWTHSHHPPSVEDFDKKLTESDAYLQLLIDQIKDLELKIEKLSEEEEEKHQMLNVYDKANALLESIKHSIVLLQIAKNTTHPVNGIYQPTGNIAVETSLSKSLPLNEMTAGNETFQNNSVGVGNISSSSPQLLVESREAVPSHVSSKFYQVEGDLVYQTVKSSSVETNLGPHGTYVPGVVSTSSSLGLLVPATSYSSSDDDDFYDANEDVTSGVQSPSNPKLFEDVPESLQAGKEEHNPPPQQRYNKRNILNSDNSINYDLIYEDDGEDELGSLENQGSVISHLLSQVKIGMDLTKVVLPTFILERRSLLEMYADFFAHPDIFTSIPDYEDPKDRMVQVVRWYLSAFHAGRKSSVAKKPYNPILGEIFRCHWDVHGSEESPDKVADGPVPWAHKNNLTFVAEQVSHHPPISAFYAEHYNKGISACAHIWTKSKFLGLSIGVHNIGQGCISILKYDEEYIVTFPNGYGRSILTVPWIELGGEVTIACSKTGYSATVNFHTKPFYGGKKHRITANVFYPNDKKSFLTIVGEWNGIMYVKEQNGQQGEVFIDTKSIPVVKKRVVHVLDQEENESRRMWKDVTAALAMRNVEAASENKFILEQRQREEARERKESGTKWETKLFKELGDHWIYTTPLQTRLTQETK